MLVIRLIITWLLTRLIFVLSALLLLAMLGYWLAVYFLATGEYKDYLSDLPPEPTVVLPSNCLRC